MPMKRYIKNNIDLGGPFDEDFAFSGQSDNRAHAARMTDSEDLLWIYVYDPDLWVRYAVTDNPFITAEMLDALADDPDFDVRRQVARHPGTSPEALLKLASSDSFNICADVVDNANTPREAFELLENRDEPWIVHVLLYGRYTPEDIKQRAQERRDQNEKIY